MDDRLPGLRSAPGGPLVQETEQFAPVRGARFGFADSDGVRSNVTASWLRPMNNEVHVVDDLAPAEFSAIQALHAKMPPAPPVGEVDAQTLAGWLRGDAGRIAALDCTAGANYVRRHIPGAWFMLRFQLGEALEALPAGVERYVLTCGSSALARFAAADLAQLTDLLVRARPAHVICRALRTSSGRRPAPVLGESCRRRLPRTILVRCAARAHHFIPRQDRISQPPSDCS